MKFKTRLFDWLAHHPVVTFLLMAAAFTLFGALSLNMASYVSANARYLADNGWMGLMDGGLAQLADLASQILIANFAWVVFKLCEHALIERVAYSQKGSAQS